MLDTKTIAKITGSLYRSNFIFPNSEINFTYNSLSTSLLLALIYLQNPQNESKPKNMPVINVLFLIKATYSIIITTIDGKMIPSIRTA
jgi:hypothetical protein